MAALSTLELMLRDIQNQEDLGHHETLPVLPQRPVSKARMPSLRTKRAVLSFHFREFGGKMEEFIDGKSKRDGFAFVDGGLVLSKNEMDNDGEEKAEKGIIGIQRCFRGYLARFNYHNLKEGTITLQSFVRGENARREFRNLARKIRQAHINQEFVWKPLRNRETSIIYLQSGESIEPCVPASAFIEPTSSYAFYFLLWLVVRSWLSRRRLGYIENGTIENMNEAKDVHKEDIESEEHVMVSTSYIRDLERQVLRAEAALRQKKQENSNLKLQIQQIDRKWELHKAKMNLKEKSWQDEFTSIQMSLASAQEMMTKEITHLPQNPTRQQENGKTDLTIREILEVQESDMHETDCGFGMDNILNSRKCREYEFKKLKGRFKAWKKEFRARLYDVKRRLDRFDDDSSSRTERVHKTCWVG